MKLHQTVLLAILFVAVLVFAYTKLRPATVKPTPAPVNLPGSSGVIFPANSVDRGSWTPKQSDVVEAENGLPSFVKQAAQTNPAADLILKKGLTSYKRQYVGFSESADKVLFINLFCDDMGHDWQRQMIEVIDGGPCFFNVQFSMGTKKFSHLHINPQA